jgi:nuclear pore complex protein Nup107
MNLTAARMLASRITSSDIARNKTRAILGQSLDFEQLEYAGEDEDLTEVLDGSADEKRLMRKHLVAEAKKFRELETLIQSLDHMDTIASLGHLMKE